MHLENLKDSIVYRIRRGRFSYPLVIIFQTLDLESQRRSLVMLVFTLLATLSTTTKIRTSAQVMKLTRGDKWI